MKMQFNILRLVILFAAAINFAVIQKVWADPSETKPAVSAINAEALGSYLDINHEAVGLGGGTVTLPLGHSFGLAVDAIGGSSRLSSAWGLGSNLFWRNPDKGLIGLVGSVDQIGASEVRRGGATGELYLKQFSVLANVGFQDGSRIKNSAFSDLDLRWYATDNLALTAGAAYANRMGGVVGAEYMPGIAKVPGLAFFINGDWGGGHNQSVLAGVKYYFGSTDKSLKARHREDDPDNSALDGFVLGGQSGFPGQSKSTTPSTPPVIIT